MTQTKFSLTVKTLLILYLHLCEIFFRQNIKWMVIVGFSVIVNDSLV